MHGRECRQHASPPKSSPSFAAVHMIMMRSNKSGHGNVVAAESSPSLTPQSNQRTLPDNAYSILLFELVPPPPPSPRRRAGVAVIMRRPASSMQVVLFPRRAQGGMPIGVLLRARVATFVSVFLYTLRCDSLPRAMLRDATLARL